MGRFLVQWRLNTAILPYDDPAEYEKLMTLLSTIVKNNLKTGTLEEWGLFLDSEYGYSIHETDSESLMKNFIVFEPYIQILEVHEVLTVDNAMKALKDGLRIKMEMMKK